jgi:hypothetical protein
MESMATLLSSGFYVGQVTSEVTIAVRPAAATFYKQFYIQFYCIPNFIILMIWQKKFIGKNLFTVNVETKVYIVQHLEKKGSV